MNFQVESSCEYNNLNYIHRFEDTFKLAGGINLPKIINCIGSDGRKYKQLVKVGEKLFFPFL